MSILKHRVIVSFSDQDLKDLDRLRGKTPVSSYLRSLFRSHVLAAKKARKRASAAKKAQAS